MLKKGTFIRKKFYSMLFFNLLSVGMDSVNTMIDAILGGNQLGEVALQAVSIVAPLVAFITFCSYMFTTGCGILYGMSIGRFDRKEANRTAGTSALSSLIIGIVGAAFLFAVKMPFLRYFGCTGDLLKNASEYYNWFILLMLISPVSATIYNLLVAEGAALFLLTGTVFQIVSNMILSYVLCAAIGVSGLGIATVISKIVVTLIFTLHFFTKRSTVHFAIALDFKILKQALILSAHKALNYVFLSAVDIIMNKIIILICGQTYISAYSVVNLILTLFLITAGVSDSCQGMLTSFIGERNNYGVHNVLRMGMTSVLIINIVLMLALFFAAPLMPVIYGLTTPEVVAASIRATRIVSVSAVPFGIAYFAYSIYVCLNKPALSIIMAFLYNFFCPLVLSIPLAFAMGFDGVSVGMSLSSFLVIVLFVCFLCGRYGRNGFPWYLEETGEEAFGYDLYVTNETITEIRDKVKAEMDRHGYEIKNLELLIEELYTRIYEKNPGKTVCSECALLFGADRVRIIVRDNGVLFNFVDENNSVESLNAYVLNSLLERVEYKQYLITTSFNRNGFVFEK